MRMQLTVNDSHPNALIEFGPATAQHVRQLGVTTVPAFSASLQTARAQ
jgi:hypothetical protein